MHNLNKTAFLLLLIILISEVKSSNFDELPFELKKNVIRYMDVKTLRTIAQTSTSMYFITKPKLEDYVYKLPIFDDFDSILLFYYFIILLFYKDSYIKKVKRYHEIILLNDIVKRNSSNCITHLNLRKCNINHEKLKVLCQLINQQKALQSLKLSENNIHDEDALYIAQMIERNKSLIELDVSHNRINYKGSDAIIKSINKNPLFQKLDFTDNQISPKGFKVLGKILQHSAHFKSFSFSKNIARDYIKHRGIKAFAAGLAKNESLEELYLNNHLMSVKRINSLLKVLIAHKSIRIFSLICSFVQDDNMPYLQALIENNNTLEKLYITDGYLSDFNRYQISVLNCKKPHLEIQY